MSTVDFIDKKAANEYLCAICLEVMEQPVQIGCNGGHLFCGSCIVNLIQSHLVSQTINNTKCPKCNGHFHPSSIVNIPFIQRKINDLKVKCPNYSININKPNASNTNNTNNANNTNNRNNTNIIPPSISIQIKTEKLSGKKRKRPSDDDDDDDILILNNNNNNNIKRRKIDCKENCDWIGRYGELNEHINKCPLTLINCRYSSIGCTAKIKRKNMKIHINECEYCPIICDQCNMLRISRGYLKNHILNDCINTMIKCEQCGNEMKRNEMVQHIKHKCIETVICCEYKKFGCDIFKRKYLKKHNEKNIDRHLRLIKESHNKLEQHVICLTNRITQIEQILVGQNQVNFAQRNLMQHL